MACSADDVEPVSGQTEVKRLYKRAGREFGRHEHIAEYPDALACDDRLDGVKFLSETQMLHVREIGQVAPSAPGDREPSLPARRLDVGRRPVGMNEDMLSKIGRISQPSSGEKQVRAADRPERVTQKLFRNALSRRLPGRGIADRYIRVSRRQVKNTVGADDIKRCIRALFSPVR